MSDSADRFSGRARRDLVQLLLLSLVVRIVVAALTARPGYMDVAYYASGAVNLAQGGGLSEPFIWHYLDDPPGIPHVGFLYWMPLPSLLAAPFSALFPGSFFALQLPFALLSALLPVIAYVIAWQVAGAHRQAWIAGLLTLFSGFFFPYWTLPETFAPFGLVGSLALWLTGNRGPRSRPRAWRWLLIGGLVGLAHLTRADGVLLLPVVASAPLLRSRSWQTRRHLLRALGRVLLVVLGYLLIMGPWFARNVALVGVPLSSAGAKTLWLTDYDDLFCYGCDLSPRSYLAWGWDGIVRSKLWALGWNLQRFLAEDCLVFLLPFILIGLVRLRHRVAMILSTAALVLFFLVHSLLFTFPGARGGFFHATAAVLPFLFVLGVEGIEAAVSWAAGRRGWRRRQALLVFGAAAAVVAVSLSIYAAAQKLPASQDADAAYLQAGDWLTEHEVPNGAGVMVGNPPAFWYHTGRPALVIPNGDVETLLAAADRYGAEYVLFDRNCPAPLAEWCSGTASHTRLEPVAGWGEETVRIVLYRVRR